MSPPTTISVSVPTTELRHAVLELTSNATVMEWDMSGPPPASQIDIVVPPYMGATSLLTSLDRVDTRLVQSQMVGYDGVRDVLPKGLVFANAKSVHETSTAELTLALVLASQRGIPDFVRAGDQGHWAPAWQPGLADHTVLLVGYGGVSQAIEARLSAFEVTIERLARTARRDARGTIHGFGELERLLPAADVVIVVVPLSPATTGLIDDAFLSLMREGSLLVNVARGQVADTDALVAHARSGRLRLALDVTDPEPLPDGHPLFALPNVLISPHVGGRTSAMLPRMAALIATQVERMQRDESPVNVVLPG
jgi:phosphoglycerate dehydrogenase-like enzyme